MNHLANRSRSIPAPFLSGWVLFISLILLFSATPLLSAELDISSQVRVNIGRPYFDYAANQTYCSISLTGLSTGPVQAPVWLVITSISTAGVSLANASGVTLTGLPYIDFSPLLLDNRLDPGETTAPITVRFNNSSRLRFSFTTMVMTTGPDENQAPIAQAGPDAAYNLVFGQTTLEVTLDGSGSSDPEGTVLSYFWSGSPDPADIARPVVSLSAGVYTFSLVVADQPGAQSQADTVTITVNPPANRPPVADAGQDSRYGVQPGQTIDIFLNASGSSDPDGDAIVAYTWSGNPDPEDTAEPAVTLGAGVYEFNLTVTDARGQISSGDSVTVTVVELSPPQITVSPTEYAVFEGESLSFQVSASDADGDQVTLSVAPLPENASFSSVPAANASGAFSFSPGFDQAGDYSLVFTATDASGLSAESTVVIHVANTNRDPIAQDAEIAVRENYPAAIELPGSDPDLDELVYSIIAQPSHGSLGGQPPQITYTPTSGFLGQDWFDYQVEDIYGAVATARITLNITANQAPRITSVPMIVADVGYEYVYPVIAQDPDGDPLSYALAAGPDGMSIGENGLLRWTPGGAQPADSGVSIVVTDAFGGQDTQTYSIRVTQQNDSNNAPVAHAGDDFTVEEGQLVTLDGAHSYDADANHLRYRWRQTEGPAVTLEKSWFDRPTFTAPQIDRNTLLTFELIVNDGLVDSPPALVRIMVLDMDIDPQGIVTNSNTDGPGSFRAALIYANSHPGTRITFNIPESDPGYGVHTPGVWTLPSFSIPGTITRFGTGAYRGPLIEAEGLFLDGTSQTSNQGDRNPYGPEIEFDLSASYWGLHVFGKDIVIRGMVINKRVLTGAEGLIVIMDGANIVITGNYLGIDATGTQAIGNKVGVQVFDLSNTVPAQNMDNIRIGGSGAGEGNLISTNGGPSYCLIGNTGLTHTNTTSVRIQGNLLGTDRTGTVACGSTSGGGITTRRADIDILIGGALPGSRNIVVDGQLSPFGAVVFSPYYSARNQFGNLIIQGNYIGTDITGTYALNHARQGIRIYYPRSYLGTIQIGGALSGQGNLISGCGNAIAAIATDGDPLRPIKIQGNLIGTDVTGTYAIPNTEYYGAILLHRAGPLVGGANPNEGNVISGNLGAGIWTENDSPFTIKGNKIGVGLDGITPMPNRFGIYVRDSVPPAVIGGTQLGEGNVIAYNTDRGIAAGGDIYRGENPLFRILGNQIHSNGNLGIDLANASYIEPIPVISSVVVGDGHSVVGGRVNSITPNQVLVELFANTQREPSGFGEGERLIGAVYAQPDGAFETLIPEDLSGLYITATSTRMLQETGDPALVTSEFSRFFLVGEAVSTNLPPQITSAPLTSILAEETYSYQVLALDPEGGAVTYAFALAPAGMQIDSQGLISWQTLVEDQGIHAVTVVVRDAQGLLASQNFRVQVLEVVDLTPPVISVQLPPDYSVSGPTDLVGSIYDNYLAWFGIEIAPAGSGNYTLIAEGTQSIRSGALGAIDPTRFANGLYDLRISAYDQEGRLSVQDMPKAVDITGKLKIGQFALSFEDITVPLSGLPITVRRTYNSFNKARGDFGIGWDLALMSGIKVQVTRSPLGTGWRAVEDYFWGNYGVGAWVYKLETDRVPKVIVTYPDGRQERFEFAPDFIVQPAIDPRYVRVAFRPLDNSTASLEAVGDTELLLFPQPSFPDGERLVTSDFETYNPDRFRLTTAEGVVYLISQSTGLVSITDRNGNTLTFSGNGISHSSGQGISMARDSAGRITQIVDPQGNAVAYAYDSNGDLVRFTDQQGNITVYSYDDQHNLVSIVNALGEEILRTTYDENGRMLASVDGLGHRTEVTHDIENTRELIRDGNANTTAIEYDADGNVLSETDPLGHTTSYTYDGRGNMLSKTDPLGNTTTYTYDARNNKLSKTDPLGHTVQWRYNEFNRLLSETDALGNITEYDYDASGNLIAKTNALGEMTTYEYDSNGNRISMLTCDASQWTYAYDQHGRKIAETDPLGNTTSFAYDSLGNEIRSTTTRTGPSGPVTMTTSKRYDALGRLIQSTDAQGHTESFEYNAIGQKIAQVDKNGNRTLFEYDAIGKLTRVVFPDGTFEAYQYDGNGNRTASTDRSGRTTEYIYDAVKFGGIDAGAQNRLVRIVFADGSAKSFEYDAASRPTAVVDENGNRSRNQYDAASRVTATIDALGNTTTNAYDANGNLIAVTNPIGQTTSFAFDALNRQVAARFADGTETLVEYAAGCCPSQGCNKSLKTAETDQAGQTTFTQYDPLGRVIARIDAAQNQTAYSYDQVGNLIAVTNANGHTTRFQYDNLGRLTRRTLPLGMSETYEYDPNGNLISKTDFNGDTITYQYNTMNLVALKELPDGSRTQYVYWPSNKKRTVSDSRGQTSYSYDSRDRLIAVQNPDGSRIGYTYDSKGNRLTASPDSGTTSYIYDAADRLVRVTEPDGAFTSYAYDPAGNRIQTALPNGAYSECSYDSLNRLVQILHYNSSDELLSGYDYVHDPTGKKIRVAEANGRTVNYAYDSVDRLVSEQISDPISGNRSLSYTYDGVGNRLTKTDSFNGVTHYVYDANDQLISEAAPAATLTYAYDHNGNMIEKSGGGTYAAYAYNGEGRLTGYTDSTSTAHYVYDEDGIRVRSEVNADTVRYTVDKTTVFPVVLEKRDGAATLLSSYVYGNQLISQNLGGDKSYYHQDGQGSTMQLSDAAGMLTDGYTYDAFGNTISASGTTPNEFLYTGEQFDSATNSYYLRARYYDPQTGRFTTHDPRLGDKLNPVSMHRYLYANADPVNNSDPSGEFTLTEKMTVVTIIGISAQTAFSNYFNSLSAKHINWTGTIISGAANLPASAMAGGVSFVRVRSLCDYSQIYGADYDTGNFILVQFGISASLTPGFAKLPLDASVCWGDVELKTPGFFGPKSKYLAGLCASAGLSASGVYTLGVGFFEMGMGQGKVGISESNCLNINLSAQMFTGVAIPVPPFNDDELQMCP